MKYKHNAEEIQIFLKWEPIMKSPQEDPYSVCATYMGVSFHVEWQEDGRYLLSTMVHGALYELGTIAIKARAISKMERIFNEMLAVPADVMRVAEKYAID